MTDIAKSGVPSYCSVTPSQDGSIVGLLAGETVAAGDACYVKSDGKIWKATGAADTAPADVAGFAPRAAVAGEPLSLYTTGNFRYGSGLTPGAKYYLSGAVAGAIADAVSTGGRVAIAFALDTTRIRIIQSGLNAWVEAV